MLELIIALLKLTFENKKYFEKVYGLATLVERGELRFPAEYQANDDYKRIDLEDSALYFRKRGEITRFQNEDEASGCEDMVTVTIPLTAIAYVPKNIFKTDNAFIDEKITSNITNIIENASYNNLRLAMKADDLECSIKGASDNRYDVWQREFKGVDMAARHDHVLCFVNFDIEIRITSDCLANFECNDGVEAVTDDSIQVNVADPLAWHITGNTLLEAGFLGSLNSFPINIGTGGVAQWQLTTDGHLIPLQANNDIGSETNKVDNLWVANLHYDVITPILPLSSVLGSGNTTGGNDIILSAGDAIVGAAGATLTDANLTNYYFAGPNYLYQQTVGLSGTDYILQDDGTTIYSDAGISIQSGDGTYQFYGGTSEEGIFDFTNVATTDKTYTFQNLSGIVALQAAALTPNSIVIVGASGELTEDLLFNFDPATNRFGLNLAAPSTTFDMVSETYTGTGTLQNVFRIGYTNTTIGITNGELFSVKATGSSANRYNTTVRIGGGSDTSTHTIIVGNDASLAVGLRLDRGNSKIGVASTNGIIIGDASYVINRAPTANDIINAGVGVTTYFRVDGSGNASFGTATTNGRVNIVGAANSVAINISEDGGTSYFKCEEVAGVKQMGFNNVATVARPLVPLGSSADDINNALTSLGLFRQS